MTRRLTLRTLAPIALLLLLLGACSPAGRDAISVTATFDDVIDLVTNAHVRAGDIPIGTVTAIELTDDLKARVTMDVRRGTGLTSQVRARLLQTTILGERFVELVPLPQFGGELEEGAQITDTEVVRDFEDLVLTGSSLLGAISVGQLAQAVEVGATAFGGRGGILQQFLDDVGAFLGAYDENKDDLVRVIDSLDVFLAELAPAAETNAAALGVLADASRALEDEDDRLLDALDDLRRLSNIGTDIMSTHRAEIDNGVRRLRIILDQITRIDGALQQAITWINRHNLHVANAIINEGSQIWQDFVICGFNDTPGDAAGSCVPPNPGEEGDPPAYINEDDPCNDDHTECPGYVGEGRR